MLVAVAREVATAAARARAARAAAAMVEAAMAKAMAEAVKAVKAVVMTVETAVGMAARRRRRGLQRGWRTVVDVATSEHRHSQMQLVQRSEPCSSQHAPRHRRQ